MTAKLAADDTGSALIVVVLVSMLMMSLLVLVLKGQDQANTTSVRDSNYDLALSVAESGVQAAMARLQGVLSDQDPANDQLPAFQGSTPQGPYTVSVTRTTTSLVIESRGASGGIDTTKRERVVRVTMDPPMAIRYAIYSNTSVDTKNNDHVEGDVWANDSVSIDSNDTVEGSITSATSWIDLGTGARVTGDVWSGGYSPSLFSVRLGDAEVEGDVKASVTAPSDPTTCGGEPATSYRVVNDGAIGGDLRTWGVKAGSGSLGGMYSPATCSDAAIPQPMPTFTWNPSNYDAAGLRTFTSVAAFNVWLAGNITNLRGTLRIDDPYGSQANRIDLTGATITGDTTIVTNAPVYTGGVQDAVGQKVFVVVSTYEPPTGSACDVNHDGSECAIHVKNSFEPSCRTAALLFASRGPVAVKNNSDSCGAVYGDSVLIKNGQRLTYDPRLERLAGFGSSAYVVSRWEERPAR